jgi:peptidoglycan/LPS O-acetylase OafA/YrhL
MVTLANQLAKTGGRPAGFDYLRLGLSVAVIAFHSVTVSYGVDGEHRLWISPLGPICFSIVPAFFALSGFLVAGSLQRNDLASFLTLRALRIFPALVVEVVLSAVILGALLTTLPLSEYLSSPMFRDYFLNIIGDIHFYLPGVFIDHPFPSWVNIQLWTVPFELKCYILLSLFALARMHKRPALLMAVVTAAALAAFAHDLMTHRYYPGYGRPNGYVLILSFLFGVALYSMRDRIPFSWPGVMIAAVASYLLLAHGATVYLALLPIAYVTVFLGLCDPPRTSLVLGADYSYGMYLYGFPIQQTIAFLFPETRVGMSTSCSACP